VARRLRDLHVEVLVDAGAEEDLDAVGADLEVVVGEEAALVLVAGGEEARCLLVEVEVEVEAVTDDPAGLPFPETKAATGGPGN